MVIRLDNYLVEKKLVESRNKAQTIIKEGLVSLANTMIKFEDACKLKKWHLVEKSPSKLTGKEGNLEYCYFFKKLGKS